MTDGLLVVERMGLRAYPNTRRHLRRLLGVGLGLTVLFVVSSVVLLLWSILATSSFLFLQCKPSEEDCWGLIQEHLFAIMELRSHGLFAAAGSIGILVKLMLAPRLYGPYVRAIALKTFLVAGVCLVIYWDLLWLVMMGTAICFGITICCIGRWGAVHAAIFAALLLLTYIIIEYACSFSESTIGTVQGFVALLHLSVVGVLAVQGRLRTNPLLRRCVW